MRITVVALTALLAAPPLALAQAPKPVVQTDSVERSATIEAIDYANRHITLKNKEGVVETMSVGPEVKRFSELKVGDTLSFRYYESTAFSIRKAGQAAPAPATGEPALTRGTGAKPSATLAKQANATVTIKSIDAKVPSVTVLTSDGKTASFRVENPKNIEGLKVGDKVDITYTEALVISVK